MKYSFPKLVPILMIVSLISACATAYKPLPTFTPVDIDASGRALKTQNAIVILDASSSMEEGYQQWKKFDIAKAVVHNLAETIPEDLGIKSGLRTFGHDPNFSMRLTQMIDGMGEFDKATIQKALSSVAKAGGTSPLSDAITAASGDLNGLDGKSAMIIVSDGKDMG